MADIEKYYEQITEDNIESVLKDLVDGAKKFKIVWIAVPAGEYKKARALVYSYVRGIGQSRLLNRIKIVEEITI